MNAAVGQKCIVQALKDTSKNKALYNWLDLITFQRKKKTCVIVLAKC